MATAYGSTLGLDTQDMILALLVTQVVAVPCSILFRTPGVAVGFDPGHPRGHPGVCRHLRVGFLMGRMVETAPAEGLQEAVERAGTLFWVLAGLVGTVQGGIQALSRCISANWCPPAVRASFSVSSTSSASTPRCWDRFCTV
jgi:UMF1 family MFS transporter